MSTGAGRDAERTNDAGIWLDRRRPRPSRCPLARASRRGRGRREPRGGGGQRPPSRTDGSRTETSQVPQFAVITAGLGRGLPGGRPLTYRCRYSALYGWCAWPAAAAAAPLSRPGSDAAALLAWPAATAAAPLALPAAAAAAPFALPAALAAAPCALAAVETSRPWVFATAEMAAPRAWPLRVASPVGHRGTAARALRRGHRRASCREASLRLPLPLAAGVPRVLAALLRADDEELRGRRGGRS